MIDLYHNKTLTSRLSMGYGGLFYGVYPALVTAINDPDSQGRVKVRLPWSPDSNGDEYEVWARLATMMAGNNRGSWFIPDVSDEVLLCFEGGNPRRPYVIGMLWNGQDAPPEQMDSDEKNDIKTLKSRNGVTISLDDTSGEERLVMKTPGGQEIILKDGPGSIEMQDSNGNSIKLESAGLTINADTSKVTVKGSTNVEIKAPTVTVNSGMSKFNGVVKAETVITNSVVSSSYTPGAGNIW